MSIGLVILFVIILLVMFVGLWGVLLPVLPGIPLIFGAAFVFAIIEGFELITWNTIALFAILTAASLLIDYLATMYGVRRMGGTKLGMVGALAGMFIGLLTSGLPGLIIGSFVGAYGFELIGGKRSSEALRSSTGSFIGLIGGGVIKFAVGAVMIGIFVWRIIF